MSKPTREAATDTEGANARLAADGTDEGQMGDPDSEREQAIEAMRRSFGLRMSARGQFFVGDEPVEHPGVARLFRSSLDRLDSGDLIVRVGTQWTYLTVEDQPYRASSARIDGAGTLLAFLDDGREVAIAWSSLVEDERGLAGLAPTPTGALIGVRLSNAAAVAASEGLSVDEDGRLIPSA